uniref:helix-turn-helix domain-containing protein n=1 Tax=Serratia quinivorans TaxID=137545 RepID=UPI0035C72C29
MTDKFEDSAAIIERLTSSYGVTSQRALASSLDVPPNNVSSWVQRNSVPGSAVIKCALDTGADLRWLMTGKFENSNFEVGKSKMSGRALYEQIQASGGKPVLRRMLDAYGFRTQKELGDLLDISGNGYGIGTYTYRLDCGDLGMACEEYEVTSIDNSVTNNFGFL